MKNRLPLLVLTLALSLAGCGKSRDAVNTPASTVPDQPAAETQADGAANPLVGGVAMSPGRTITDNTAAAPNLTILVRAITAAGLATTLAGPGPFTVFAPSNDAFGRLAPGTVDSLLKPENKGSLVKVLTYHVVAGNITSADLAEQVAAGGGTATLTTVEGEPLVVTMQGNIIGLADVNGNRSYVEVADVRQSNGVIHVVNGVLVPKLD